MLSFFCESSNSHSFPFKSQNLYDLKQRARLSKSASGIFHWIPFLFVLKFRIMLEIWNLVRNWWCRICYWWNCNIWLTDYSKLAINQINDNGITVFWHDVILKCFWRYFVSFFKFSYCSKFHVSIISPSEVTTSSCYKRTTRNLKIRKPPVWVLPNMWRLG